MICSATQYRCTSPERAKVQEQEMQDKQTEALTREAAAARLQTSLATLDRMIKAGKIKAVKMGKRVLVVASEVERILRGGAQ